MGDEERPAGQYVSVHAAMADVQRRVEVIAKSRQGHGNRYNYRGIDDIISGLHDILAEVGLVIVPAIEDVESLGKNGAMVQVKVRLRFTFFGPEGDSFSVPYVMLAQNTEVDKAVGTAQSYATRYLYQGAFSIPAFGDDMDPEARNDDPPAKKTKRRSGGVEVNGESSQPRVTVADLAKACSDSGVDQQVVVDRANMMRPTAKTPFKTLQTVTTDQSAARELLELVLTGQIMNAQAEPFPVDRSPAADVHAELTEAASIYKQAVDPNYLSAQLVAEVEAAEGVKIEGGFAELIEHHPELAVRKAAALRDAAKAGAAS